MLVAAAAALAAAACAPPAARAADDPEWPCVQRLVPELAAGQMWAGTPPEDLPAGAALDPALAGLPAALAGRDLPVEAAEAEAEAALARLPEAGRPAQRALLFREVLARVNAERSTLIAGIKRSARGQRRLAEKITADGRRLDELRADPAGPAASDELRAARDWDMRLFDDRQRAVRALCDQPVLLEQRAFALARALQE